MNADLILSCALARIENEQRQPINAEAAKRLKRHVATMAPLAAVHRLNGKSRGVAYLDWLLLHPNDAISEIVGDDIKAIRPKMSVGTGMRVDWAIEHTSGRLTLIEVRDSGSQREIAQGIGVLLLCRAVIERTASHGQVVHVLAALIDEDQDLRRACNLAGVGFLPMGSVRQACALSRIADFCLNPATFMESER